VNFKSFYFHYTNVRVYHTSSNAEKVDLVDSLPYAIPIQDIVRNYWIVSACKRIVFFQMRLREKLAKGSRLIGACPSLRKRN